MWWHSPQPIHHVTAAAYPCSGAAHGVTAPASLCRSPGQLLLKLVTAQPCPHDCVFSAIQTSFLCTTQTSFLCTIQTSLSLHCPNASSMRHQAPYPFVCSRNCKFFSVESLEPAPIENIQYGCRMCSSDDL